MAHYRHTGWITFCICCRDLTEGQWEGTQNYSTYIVISGLHKSTPTSFQSSQQFPFWKTTSLLQRTCRSLKYRRCILYGYRIILNTSLRWVLIASSTKILRKFYANNTLPKLKIYRQRQRQQLQATGWNEQVLVEREGHASCSRLLLWRRSTFPSYRLCCRGQYLLTAALFIS